jgi:hypothetical protein
LEELVRKDLAARDRRQSGARRRHAGDAENTPGDYAARSNCEFHVLSPPWITQPNSSDWL